MSDSKGSNFSKEEAKKLAVESKKYFQNALGEFVYYRTYSKWIDEKGKRETWVETVDRFMDFMKENVEDKFSDQDYTLRCTLSHQSL